MLRERGSASPFRQIGDGKPIVAERGDLAVANDLRLDLELADREGAVVSNLISGSDPISDASL
jgi:hypothetical protein